MDEGPKKDTCDLVNTDQGSSWVDLLRQAMDPGHLNRGQVVTVKLDLVVEEAFSSHNPLIRALLIKLVCPNFQSEQEQVEDNTAEGEDEAREEEHPLLEHEV